MFEQQKQILQLLGGKPVAEGQKSGYPNRYSNSEEVHSAYFPAVVRVIYAEGEGIDE